MTDGTHKLASHVTEIDKELERPRVGGSAVAAAVGRWRSDAAALLFHLDRRDDHPPLVALLGGTGTGKSTVVNRLLEADASATSFRRTFTAGAVAMTRDPEKIPVGWLGVPRDIAPPERIPVRGQVGSLVVVPLDRPLTAAVTLLDTPDLDGDQPAHHAEADRAFRWAEAVVFLVTPEKYQMTELLPYYRLARRYGLPALFVMNKCEESAVLDDFRQQLAGRDWPDAPVFVLARDDAAYEPPPETGLAALRTAVAGVPMALKDPARRETHRQAMGVRAADLAGRLRDQIIAPLRDRRREIDRLTASLRSLTTAPPGVDVSPVTTQLQRRLQEQSVLYLMGPQRVFDRVRQMPGLLAKLPRTAWDVFRGEAVNPAAFGGAPSQAAPANPDFPAVLADQFTILHSRIDDVLASSLLGETGGGEGGGVGSRESGVRGEPPPKIPAAQAAAIATEELAALKQWLEQRWQNAPRDTQAIQRLLKAMPGGKALTKYSEAAPYLLAVVVAAHGAVFGPIDLIILGTFSLATWIGEKVSNEVTSRTRQTNRQVADRFLALAREQIERTCAWLERQAPAPNELHRLERLADGLGELL